MSYSMARGQAKRWKYRAEGQCFKHWRQRMRKRNRAIKRQAMKAARLASKRVLREEVGSARPVDEERRP